MKPNGRKYGDRQSRPIPVWNGILDHRERMGGAIWEFLWCLDRVTKEINGVGLVLGGKPVKVGEMRLTTTSLGNSGNGTILRTLKRGRPVTLGIHPELAAAIEEHLKHRTAKQRKSEYVFASVRGTMPTGIDAALARLFTRCGIENGHPHRFRDTFAVRLLANGASLYDVAKLLGIDISTAEKHYSPWVRELQERATRLIAGLSLPVVQFRSSGLDGVSQSRPTKSESSAGNERLESEANP